MSRYVALSGTFAALIAEGPHSRGLWLDAKSRIIVASLTQKPCGQKADRSSDAELVRMMMRKLLIILLVIPLLVVMAAKDPHGMANLLSIIFTVGAKLLNATAALLSALLGGHPH